MSISTTEIYTCVSIVKLKQRHEMTHSTLYQKQAEKAPGAIVEELLAKLDDESSEDR